MAFRPEELLFLPTTDCNLNCPHCTQKRSKQVLSKSLAVKFLRDCAKNNIKKIGFTGGEPFLVQDFMLAVVREAVRNNLFFDRIMTNGSWFRTDRELKVALSRLREAGYDGSICVSIDAFHAQNIEKVANFIKEAVAIFGRKDIVSIAYTGGAGESATKTKLNSIAGLLNGRLIGFGSAHPRITSKDVFIKISRIELSPVGRAARLKDPWDGKWFKEDRCKGPGNVFLVMPNGDVKPCCGYASDLKELTIGNIGRDNVKKLIANAKNNKLVNTIFTSGLSSIRKCLESSGAAFPGKTSNHCYFCYHLLTQVPGRLLKKVI
jgi:radical SAM protein with 4Fe4S-binding SPASM domain